MSHRASAALAAALLAGSTVGVILPAAQQRANSHMNAGPTLGFVHFAVSCGLRLVVLARPRVRWPWALPIVVLIGGGLRLVTLGCLGSG